MAELLYPAYTYSKPASTTLPLNEQKTHDRVNNTIWPTHLTPDMYEANVFAFFVAGGAVCNDHVGKGRVWDRR
mgnify:CR=1 FL=1